MSSFRADLVDGTTIIEENLNRVSEGFPLVLAASEARNLAEFTVFLDDGSVFSVNTMTGVLHTDGENHTPVDALTTPLRIIYYKTMRSTLGESGTPETHIYCVTLGWQTTTEDGKNIKVGIKVYPLESRYEITEGV